MPKNKFRGMHNKEEQECQRLLEKEEETGHKNEVEGGAVVVIDNADELHAMPGEKHRIVFQSHYKEEKQ
eukprot:14460604-Ditylum_brightwellii.AAC.1